MIEVVIAALLLTVVVVGATAVLGGSSRTTASTKVRDKQTSLANGMLAKLQADPSWSTWCRARQRPFNPANPKCDLGPWMDSSPEYSHIGELSEGGSPLKFTVSTIATGIDFPADGVGSSDEDGVVPDIYRLSLSIVPTPDVSARFPQLKPMTVQSDSNPSVRVVAGRVSIDACRAINQVDERVPIGDCKTSTSATEMLPPPTLNTSSDSRIQGSCVGPISDMRGGDNRDCHAYKCANPDVASLPVRGLRKECNHRSYPGWEPPSSWSGNEVTMTKIVTGPVTGSVYLENLRTRDRTVSKPFVGGRASFDDLPVGEYRIWPSVTGSGALWRSKSVPSTQQVSVEAGLNSRAVLIYRPGATGSVRIPIRSVDASIPWAPRQWPGWMQIDDNGNPQTSPTPVKVCLVPVPQGRLNAADVPCKEFPWDPSTRAFTFDGVEPGLYSAQLSTQNYNSFMSISGTAGLLWVPEGGPVVPTLRPTTAPFEFVQGLCAKNIRATIIGVTPPPGYTVVTQQCSAPGGAAGGGGGGGGGGQ